MSAPYLEQTESRPPKPPPPNSRHMNPTTAPPPPPPPAPIATFISDHRTLTLLHTKCRTMRDLRLLHSHLIRSGLARDPIAASRLLAFCATSPSGDLNYAALLLSHSPHPTPFMYNTLIRALSRSSSPRRALAQFGLMLRSPTRPDHLTFPSLFVACAHLAGDPHPGAQIHAMAIKLGHAADPYVRNSIISMYAAAGRITTAMQLYNKRSTFDIVACNSMVTGLARNGLVDDARQLFNEMPKRNDVTWSAMISGYARNGRHADALDLFSAMQELGVAPNANTLTSLLGACAGLGALPQGEWVHAYIEKNGFEENPIMVTAVIDMYCKCGRIDKACEVFEGSSKRGLSEWNSMISGLAIHGRGEEAMQLFSRLQSAVLRPDGVSFLCILNACNHSGMVREARYYFLLMKDVYDIEPAIEHYGCMVDVLGRAGLIEEAEELIQSMPVEPDVVIWGSLLSACRIYGDVEIGEKVGMRLMELDPWNSSAYVLLSNAYAGGGQHTGAVGARVVMKEKKVRKEPGCSMIVVSGVAYEFVAGGVLHTRSKEIYVVLDWLSLMLRQTGNVDIVNN